MTGLSKHLNTLKIGDEWFEQFFQTLEEYNFTIDENSTVDVEISVDPEMLGRIFENLLAAIDQDTGEMARKATGSFYTPREIVDYMATESLLLYLHNETGARKEKLHELFKVVTETKFDDERESLLDALERLKILDPACGSGAFPMGVLQKILLALRKLDEDSKWWKERQLKQINNAIIRRQVREKLDSTNAEYVRKIGIIQNTLYGVDIQPIAAEISKLRCFLTLIVDETIDDAKPNRGVEPLPNLEFKFVTADALLKLPESLQRGLFNSDKQLDELSEIRQDYLQSYGEEKAELKRRFEEMQNEILDQQTANFRDVQDSRAMALSLWKPFSHDKTPWFDSLWMFGVDAFDIVIGNPPYVRLHKLSSEYKKILWQHYKSFVGKADLYCCFVENSLKLLHQKGAFAFIISNGFLRLDSFEMLRKILLENVALNKIIDYEGNVFNSAAVKTAILTFSKNEPTKNHLVDVARIEATKRLDSVLFKQIEQNHFCESYKSIFDLSIDNESDSIKDKMRLGSTELGNVFQISFGLKTGDDSKFVTHQRLSTKYKPLLRGENVQRYSTNFRNEYVHYVPVEMRQHKVTARPGTKERFEQPKTLVRDTGNGLICTFDDKNFYVKDVLIVSDVKRQINKLKVLTAVLNSKPLKFFYETSFPTLHVQRDELASLPIKFFEGKQEKDMANLVDYIIFLKSQPLADVIDKLMPVYFEQIIDGMVYELYFPELLKEHGREIIKHLGELPHLSDEMSDERKMKIIRSVFNRLNDREHPVRNNLFYLDSIPEIRLIEGKDEAR